ncbi:MAG: hypothetical protein CMJ46_01885 [Planctomyces sp.]|nr:hypothetical protein [Planctomyces sp.]
MYLSVCFILLFTLAGCGDSEVTSLNPGGEADAQPNPFEPKEGAAPKGDEDVYSNVDRSRTTFEGSWILTSTMPAPKEQFLIDADIALVEIAKDKDGNFTGKIAETSNPPEGVELPHLEELQVDGNNITFTLHQGEQVLPCDGQLKDGIVYGTIFANQRMLLPLRMFATDATSLSTDQNERGRPTPRTEKFLAALKSEQPQNALYEFTEKYPDNPYSLNAFRRVFALVPTKDFSQEYLQKAADRYLEITKLYGERMEFDTLQMITFNLLESNKNPELAETYLAKLEEAVPEDQRQALAPILDNARKIIAVDNKIVAVQENPSQETIDQLKAVQDEYPYDERVLFTLAEYAKEQDQMDEALAYYGKLATIPFLERKLVEQWKAKQVDNVSPSVTFKELWEKKHGNLDGIEAYQEEMMQKIVESHKADVKPKEEVDGARRMILSEFYTSAPCEPCVLPHLALDTIYQALGEDELIHLSYHTHSAGPDPMATPQTLERHKSLTRLLEDKRLRAPMLTLNGSLLPIAGGFMESLPLTQTMVLKELEPMRNQKARVTLNLKAEGVDKQLHVTASTEGLVPPLDELRLRLALAEENVDYDAPNGIRHHEMVVRHMPTGAAGVQAEGDQFSFDKKFDLQQIKQGLYDYLEAFEQQSNYQFPAKPMHMKKMYLVGWVQNETTNEILQVAKVPVTGELDYGIMDQITNSVTVKPEEATTEESKPAEEKPATEEPTEEAPKTEESKPEKAEPKTEEPKEEATPEESAEPAAPEASPEEPVKEEQTSEEPVVEEVTPETESPQ